MNNRASTKDAVRLRILLVEDHEIVREGVRVMVGAQADMEVVGEAGDGSTALRLAQELRPDIIVMDISMPGMNGLQATQKMKQCCPEVKVLMLTRHTDLGFLQQILAAGASGYVLKQSASTELIRAIRTVAAGGSHLDPTIAGKVMGGFARSRSKPRAEAQGSISDREAEVLRLIALGYSNKEIAARLEISVKTVEVHKANAMRKLDMRSRIDIVRYALLQGWLQDN
ncbi:MAG TPA: response regulator transcription factor [Pyrinomonadaceae bacterium]|nr:response regulator transcription factor [Pyrinomonadaceae bacterium]